MTTLPMVLRTLKYDAIVILNSNFSKILKNTPNYVWTLYLERYYLKNTPNFEGHKRKGRSGSDMHQSKEGEERKNFR